MIDQTLVKSGFDVEVLLGARYIRYLLLNSIETGTLDLNMTIPVDQGDGTSKDLTINIYAPNDYVRNYEVNAGADIPAGTSDAAFESRILIDDPAGADLHVIIVCDVNYDGNTYREQEIELFTTFTLETETDDEGNQKNAKMNISLVDIDGVFITLALAFAGITKEEALELMKPFFDRTIDLGLVGSDQNVQNVFMKKHDREDDHPRAIGLYMNLKLKDGPEPDSFFEERGDLDDAENFLPEDNDIAFGMPGSIYPLISSDAFQKMAEESPEGSGVFRYPIHKDFSDKESDVIGSIKSITITPQSGNLIIDVHGDYQVDILPDPDFHLYITLKPVIIDGMITWEMEYAVDLNPFLEIASFVILIILSALLGPGGFIAGGIIAALVIGGQEFIVEPYLANMIEQQGGAGMDASIFDAIPNRLTVERRRWDPFYITMHQILGRTDGLQITNNGIGFSGKAELDKQPEPVTHVVIRDEQRNEDGEIEAFMYRVKDHARSSNDFMTAYPASDRMDFVKVDDENGETDLYALTPDQIEDRIKDFRLQPLILYIAKKVHVVKSQIDGIMAISQREINDLESDLKNKFRNEENDRIRAEQGDELREEAIEELRDESDEEPTDEQINERLNEKINALSEEPLNEYIENELDSDLRRSVNERLRFDLAPEEMADLQQRNILFLKSFVIIRRQGKPYYRDRADHSKRDNLLSLPHYSK